MTKAPATLPIELGSPRPRGWCVPPVSGRLRQAPFVREAVTTDAEVSFAVTLTLVLPSPEAANRATALAAAQCRRSRLSPSVRIVVPPAGSSCS